MNADNACYLHPFIPIDDFRVFTRRIRGLGGPVNYHAYLAILQLTADDERVIERIVCHTLDGVAVYLEPGNALEALLRIAARLLDELLTSNGL